MSYSQLTLIPKGDAARFQSGNGGWSAVKRVMNILHLVRKQATKQQALHQAQVLLARQQHGAA